MKQNIRVIIQAALILVFAPWVCWFAIWLVSWWIEYYIFVVRFMEGW